MLMGSFLKSTSRLVFILHQWSVFSVKYCCSGQLPPCSIIFRSWYNMSYRKIVTLLVITSSNIIIWHFSSLDFPPLPAQLYSASEYCHRKYKDIFYSWLRSAWLTLVWLDWPSCAVVIVDSKMVNDPNFSDSMTEIESVCIAHFYNWAGSSSIIFAI